LNDDSNYTNLSHRQEVRQRQKDRHNVDLSKEAQLVYEDSDWEVWIPETYAASCKLGQGTTWCTASTETSDYFDEYNDEDSLYININKHNPKEKYQYHFYSKSFMDKDDDDIDIVEFFVNNIGLYNGLYSGMYQVYEEEYEDYMSINDIIEIYYTVRDNDGEYYCTNDMLPNSVRDIIKDITFVCDYLD
jgi:hypothetical protein